MMTDKTRMCYDGQACTHAMKCDYCPFFYDRLSTPDLQKTHEAVTIAYDSRMSIESRRDEVSKQEADL